MSTRTIMQNTRRSRTAVSKLNAPLPIGSFDIPNPTFNESGTRVLSHDEELLQVCYPASLGQSSGFAAPRLSFLDLEWASAGKHAPDPRHLSTAGGLDYLALDTINPTAAHAMTYSPPSTTSGSSTSGSIFSPTQTEQSERLSTARPGYSRGPSPLAQVTGSSTFDDSASQYVCLGPKCADTFASENDLNAHLKVAHSHTCNWAGCQEPSFGNQSDLVWHVKMEHLQVCPVRECGEMSFPSKRILTCHMKVAHPEEMSDAKQSETVRESIPKQAVNPNNVPDAATPKETAISTPGGRPYTPEEKALKELLSVVASKKRCRDQLKQVLEKRARRATYGTPRSIESPTDLFRCRTPRLLESASFPIVWEHGVLPFLVEFIPKWCGPGHVISVSRGKMPQSRRICIMTRKRLSRARRVIIASHVRDLLPEPHRHSSSFCFSAGEVNRLVWARGLGKEMPDEVCQPRNPFHYRIPCMGDSIGSSDPEHGSATLGPCLVIGGAHYWLANFHPFVDEYQSAGDALVEHPSSFDRLKCHDKFHDLPREDDDFTLGKLAASSGLDLKTTRISHDPYWEECDKEMPLVVTDWTLISSRQKLANLARKFPNESQPALKDIPIKSVTPIVPGSIVVASGRTSGYQRGQVCEIPAYLSGDENGNGTGRASREWFIEDADDDDNEFIRGGMGVEGDSGAAVVDYERNGLIGQLWGRNKYWGPGPRVVYFTPMADIFDDIQEKCGQQTRPQLPQYRDDADRYPVYPTCRSCYDLRAYLDSRRGSRESVQSMIGLGGRGSEHDLTSENLSELATPRDRDQSYWLRHAGVTEGSSFNSVFSPAPAHTLVFHPNTPGADTRGPYAMTLNVEDLYDDFEASPIPSSVGKRPAPAPTPSPALATDCAGVVGSKRQRTT